MKELFIIIVLSLLTPFSLLSKQPYPHAGKSENMAYIVFKDYRGEAKKIKIRDKIANDNFDFSGKNCAVPNQLTVSYEDIEAGKVDWQTAKRICASKTEDTYNSDWKWRIPTQKEIEAIYSLESDDADHSNHATSCSSECEDVFLCDAEEYKPLKRDKYWVSTVKKGQPLYLDFSQEKYRVESASQETPMHVRCVRDRDVVLPRFKKGGIDIFRNWLKTTVKYPEESIKNKIQGFVLVKFTVDTDGSVVDIKPLKFQYIVLPQKETANSEYEVLIKEAVRVLKTSPKWAPGLVNGSPERVHYTQPIVFQTR